MTLAWFLQRLLLVRILAAFLVFAALFQVLDLIDNATPIMASPTAGSDLLRYLSLRLPLVAEQILPMAVLLGAISALLRLRNANELVAMLAAGVPLVRVFLILLPVATGLAVIHFVIADRVAPAAERAFLDWWPGIDEPEVDEQTQSGPIWARTDHTVLRVNEVNEGGRRLVGLRIYSLSAGGRVRAVTHADGAIWRNDQWLLQGVSMYNSGTGIRRFQAATWQSVLVPENLVNLAAPTRNVSFTRALDALVGDWSSQHNRAFYELEIHAAIARPLASFIMLLAAFPVAFGVGSRSTASLNAVAAAAIGFGFLLTRGMLESFGRADIVPGFVAAWLPPFVFLVLGIWFVRRERL